MREPRQKLIADLEKRLSIDSSLGGNDVFGVINLGKKNIFKNLDQGDIAPFNQGDIAPFNQGDTHPSFDAHAEHIFDENERFDDMIHRAYEGFENQHYDYVVALIDAYLNRHKNIVRKDQVVALTLQARCLIELKDYTNAFVVLSSLESRYKNIPIDYIQPENMLDFDIHQQFSEKELHLSDRKLRSKLNYKFLMGMVSLKVNPKNFGKAHDCFKYIMYIKKSMDESAFFKLFDIEKYLQILLQDASCLPYEMLNSDGTKGYERINGLIYEIGVLLKKYSDIPEKDMLKLELQKIKNSLQEYKQSRG